MSLFRNLNIRRKLILVLLSITAFSLISFSSIMAYKDIQGFKDNLARNLIVLAGAVGTNSRASIIFNDSEAATTILSSLKEEKEVQFGALYDPKGQRFASFFRDSNTDFPLPKLDKPGHRFFPDHFEIIKQIILNDEVVGTIYLYNPMDGLKSQIRAYIILVCLVLFITFVVSYFIALFLQNIISKPVLGLARITKKVSEDADFSIRVHHQSHDEIADLYSGFNTMLSQIQKRDQELHSYRTNLEYLIEQRTNELRESEYQIRVITDSLPAFVSYVDQNQQYKFFNKTYQDWFGLKKGELLGKTIKDLFSENYNQIKPFIDRALAGNRVNYEISITNREQREMQVDVSYIPHVDDYGKVKGIFILAHDVTDRKNAEKEIARSREQLRQLSNRLQEIREEEKSRISREIHDDLGQSLTALKLDLSFMGENIVEKYPETKDQLIKMAEMIDATINSVHRICLELRPRVLDVLGLSEAIRVQTSEFQKRSGIKCDVHLSHEDIQFDPVLSIVLFRIFQETLTNILRHSQANHVYISLIKKGDQLSLKVQDNGIGIPKSKADDVKSLGLLGIRERVLNWGGLVTIEGIPGEGTTVTVEIPDIRIHDKDNTD